MFLQFTAGTPQLFWDS